MNRKFLLILSSLAFAFSFTFCKHETKVDLEKENNVSSFTATDTTTVIDKANLCLQDLKEGKIDDALDMLYYVNSEGELKKIDQEEREVLTKRFELFPVLTYKLETFAFADKGDNLVKYSTTFFEKKPGEKASNVISLVFNPIKYKGEWYLTLKNKH